MSVLDNISSVPCHPQNRGGQRKTSDIKYLVYHYTGNDGDSGTNNAKYYRDNVVQASAHYFVDDDSITRSVADDCIAWAVGGKKWNDCPQTGGGTLYGLVTNANSISIEMCDTKRDGTLMATEATLAKAAELGRALMEKYNIPIDNVVRHFDVSGKHCPAYFMDSGRWQKFKKRLKEDKDMDINQLIEHITPEQAAKIVDKAQEHYATRPLPTSWPAGEELEAAKALGITDATRPMALATRLETAIMIKRAIS